MRGLTRNWTVGSWAVNLRVLSKDTQYVHLPTGLDIYRKKGSTRIRYIVPRIRLLLELLWQDANEYGGKRRFVYIQVPGRVIFQFGINTDAVKANKMYAFIRILNRRFTHARTV